LFAKHECFVVVGLMWVGGTRFNQVEDLKKRWFFLFVDRLLDVNNKQRKEKGV